MINFADENILSALEPIWKECFEVKYWSPFGVFYITNIFPQYKPLVYIEDEKPVSMLTLFPVKLTYLDIDKKRVDVDGYYVYAVATLEEYRCKKIATKMLNFLKEHAIKEEKKFSILIPSNSSPWLHNFYYKRGYNFNIKHRIINVSRAELNKIVDNCRKLDYKLEIDSLSFESLRYQNFKNTNFIKWDIGELEIVKKELLFQHNKHEIFNFNNNGYAIVDLRKENESKVIVREFYVKNKLCFIKTLLKKYEDKDFFEFTLPDSVMYYGFLKQFGTLENFAMINFYEDKLKNCNIQNSFYFNFGMDT